MKKLDPSGSFNVEEVAPGHINVTCATSDLPYTRVTALGMFCNAEDCVCERKSKEIASSFGGFFKDLP